MKTGSFQKGIFVIFKTQFYIISSHSLFEQRVHTACQPYLLLVKALRKLKKLWMYGTQSRKVFELLHWKIQR